MQSLVPDGINKLETRNIKIIINPPPSSGSSPHPMRSCRV